ncbi:Transglutaminase-like superfamily protein [Eubacterium ruminantium]|uniref:Transglutaminase-like superfamily protein n=1 Tax=Eubacterium ruminantium TaxID=42322 RepID=A0A1T4N2F7_9FIRM|nr:transglutaminase domain-containing protein [Eubacterium ruminantium]SCW51554.1 Transglutaminase-like superfamily protein [Eubacterium ruminantium]SDM67217.1 Transglutaminase-like superfamily protein [Eubacterium ruminantium]SJZ73296.1 Transglutaminase-like superfamily protein [Eubacterium ruminantium]
MEQLEEEIKKATAETWKNVIETAEKNTAMDVKGLGSGEGKQGGIPAFFYATLALVIMAAVMGFIIKRLSGIDKNEPERSSVVEAGTLSEKNVESKTETVSGKKYFRNSENTAALGDDNNIKMTDKVTEAYKSDDVTILSDKEKEVYNMATKVINSIIKEDMTDLEKEKAVIEWLHKNVAYNHLEDDKEISFSDNFSSPYVVLKNKKAYRTGYATTFRLFMKMLGIDCKILFNEDKMLVWNGIRIDNRWYYVDVYEESENQTQKYFNMTDEEARVVGY